MKTTKAAIKLSVMLLALYLISLIVTFAFASDIQPMADGTNSAKATLSISSNGLASCTISANTKSFSHCIEITMSLYRINDDSEMKSWTMEGVYSLTETKNYYVAEGFDYQITALITVRDSSGKLIESFTTTSSIVHY